MADKLKYSIPESELGFRFIASSGPGGQNVNKNATKAELYWEIDSSSVFSQHQKNRLKTKLANRLNKEGQLLISSDRFRTQLRNKEDCIAKLDEILQEALKYQKRRIPTKPSRSAKARRVKANKQHSDKKSQRRKKWD